MRNSEDPTRPVRQGSRAVFSGDLPFPIDRDLWPKVAKSIGFAPQQVRVVELVLRGKSDKQIAGELGLREPTIRTYLTRAFALVEAQDRIELILRVLATARELQAGQCHRQQ